MDEVLQKKLCLISQLKPHQCVALVTREILLMIMKKIIKGIIRDINCLSDEEHGHKLADNFSTNSPITMSSSLENSESTQNKQIHSHRGHTFQNL